MTCCKHRVIWTSYPEQKNIGIMMLLWLLNLAPDRLMQNTFWVFRLLQWWRWCLFFWDVAPCWWRAGA